ncbi:MAG: hypothetical protein ACTSUC_09610 [Promethearchaeota archaeon]
MIQIKATGIKRTIRRMMAYRNGISKIIKEDIYYAGETILERLKRRYPKLTIIGQFFEVEMEYWIYLEGDIICKVSGLRIDTALESQIGKINDALAVAYGKKIYMDLLIREIEQEAIEKIKSSLNLVLK